MLILEVLFLWAVSCDCRTGREWEGLGLVGSGLLSVSPVVEMEMGPEIAS